MVPSGVGNGLGVLVAVGSGVDVGTAVGVALGVGVVVAVGGIRVALAEGVGLTGTVAGALTAAVVTTRGVLVSGPWATIGWQPASAATRIGSTSIYNRKRLGFKRFVQFIIIV